jgi:hypothetical protein
MRLLIRDNPNLLAKVESLVWFLGFGVHGCICYF